MSGKCENCRHWEAPYAGPGNVIAPQLFGTCLLAGSDKGEPDHKESLAYAHDWEEFSATLQTLPAFGCVQFQPKI